MKSNFSKLFAVLVFATPALSIAASVEEACTLAGSVVRDALIDQTSVQVFGGRERWRDGDFYRLPPMMREMVQKDIDRIYPDVTKIAEVTKAFIPKWNEEGIDGLGMAQARIEKAFASISGLYAKNCIQRLSP